MIYIFSISLAFLGGVYVGARYSSKLLDIWHSITGK
jgi:hypothetical protein